MIDWDDVRYFLAVARGGSVRAAAKRLGVNHSTVLRRIAQLEERLGTQMFEKLPSGYRLTAAGEEVLELAEQMETSSLQLETRVFGRDESVGGLLRVTLAPPVMTAVFPFNLVISCSPCFAVSGLWLYGEVPQSLNMGSPEAGGEGGIAHIGGAKTIQLDD